MWHKIAQGNEKLVGKMQQTVVETAQFLGGNEAILMGKWSKMELPQVQSKQASWIPAQSFRASIFAHALDTVLMS